MNICIPFTHLRSETYLACKGARLFPIKDHEHGYADYWIERWQEGGTFINVEHDVVPSMSALGEMWNCPEPYCLCGYIYPYCNSRIDHSPIGCAKFSSEFIAQHQGLFVRRLHWHEPQHLIINASLNKFHQHYPPAIHLHVADDWPLDAKRRYA